MDPVELFRLRCLREADEMAVGRQRDDRVSQESQSSYVSAVEPPNVQMVSQEPVLLRAACNPGIQNPQNVVSVVNEPFVPKPPPGPPPPSPPRVLSQGCGYGSMTPPVPPPLPPFPASVTGSMSNSGGFGENPSETLRTFELPKLAGDATALQFGDWLSVVDSLMGDLSYSSGEWWAMV